MGGILRTPEGAIDYTQDFFEKPSYLTVSGQLNAEYYACALSNVYTFGPTFRSVRHNRTLLLACRQVVSQTVCLHTAETTSVLDPERVHGRHVACRPCNALLKGEVSIPFCLALLLQMTVLTA